MIPQPYNQLSDLNLLGLCVWREAQDQPAEGMRAVAHVVRNRTFRPSWWNSRIAGSYRNVILKPYQFSSFNIGDPNEKKWPADDDPSWILVQETVLWVPCGVDQDNTDGAVMYHDTSIGWPTSWGNEADFLNTLNVGRMRFYKPK
jgi:hypothetical protein